MLGLAAEGGCRLILLSRDDQDFAVNALCYFDVGETTSTGPPYFAVQLLDHQSEDRLGAR
jgi:hypothetical protein